MDWDLLLSLVFTFVCVVAVIVLIYFYSKWLSSRYSAFSNGKYMRVIDRLMIGQDKFIALLEISGRYYVIGIAGQQINLLADLGTDPPAALASTISSQSFGEIFIDTLKKKLHFSKGADGERGGGQ